MAANFQIIDANTTIGAHPDHRLNMSIERLISEMDTHTISGGLAQSTLGIYYSYIRGNAAILEAAKVNNRLVPVASVNPIYYYGASADMQAIRSQGFRIFRFYPGEQNWDIDSLAFKQILDQLAPLKVPIMIDTANAGQPSAMARIAAEYPAPVILFSISMNVLSEALAAAVKYSNVMIETHELHVPGALELISERIGSDRIIFGSGAPLRSIASSLHYITSSDLSDEDKQRVLGGNIRRVLEAV
ncbi:MAG: amidohydrolase family protein [Armatimonadota bacterium]